MSIITISRGSYSRGKQIAEKLSERLGYECLSRDILLETSDHFNIPEVKLIRAIHDAPSVLDRFSYGKQRYINYIREQFLSHIQNDNVVYHGLAGHFFVQGITNVMKVRIIAKIEDRVKEEMTREKISESAARQLLVKDDEERRKWSMNLYGIDTKDPELYDIVLHIDNIRMDDTVDILENLAKRTCFQSTPESKMMLKDTYLAAKAQCMMFETYPAATVKCKAGIAYVNVNTTLSMEAEVSEKVKDILTKIHDINDVYVNVVPIDIY
jgi:cytidylate kinase